MEMTGHSFVKAQEYSNLIKFPDKNKCIKGVSNKIDYLFQRIGDIEGNNTCFSFTGTKSQKAPGSHTVVSSAISGPIKKRRIYCESRR